MMSAVKLMKAKEKALHREGLILHSALLFITQASSVALKGLVIIATFTHGTGFCMYAS